MSGIGQSITGIILLVAVVIGVVVTVAYVMGLFGGVMGASKTVMLVPTQTYDMKNGTAIWKVIEFKIINKEGVPIRLASILIDGNDLTANITTRTNVELRWANGTVITNPSAVIVDDGASVHLKLLLNELNTASGQYTTGTHDLLIDFELPNGNIVTAHAQYTG